MSSASGGRTGASNILAAAGGALVVAVAAGGLALVQRGAAEDAAAVAESHRQDAERAATIADAQRLGAQALNAKELDLSLLLARQAVALDNSRDTQATLLGALLRSPAAIKVMRPPAGRLEAAGVTDDGRYLLVGSNDGLWPMIDTTTGTVVGPSMPATSISPDGKVLVLEGGPWPSSSRPSTRTPSSGPSASRTRSRSSPGLAISRRMSRSCPTATSRPSMARRPTSRSGGSPFPTIERSFESGSSVMVS